MTLDNGILQKHKPVATDSLTRLSTKLAIEREWNQSKFLLICPYAQNLISRAEILPKIKTR
jgi:hypothetical protein